MKRKIYLCFLLSLVTISLSAQKFGMYFLDHVPQANRYNIGQVPDAKFYLGLPIISGVGLSLTNTGFVFADLFKEEDGIRKTFTLDKIVNTAKVQNDLLADIELDLLSAGLKLNDQSFVSFSMTGHVEFGFQYDGAMIDHMYSVMTTPSPNTHISLDNFKHSFLVYREMAIGYNHQLTDELNVGARVKMLTGVAINKMDDFQMNIDSDVLGNIEMNSRMELINNLPIFEEGTDSLKFAENQEIDPMDILNNSKNKGVGFDLGAHYKLSDDFDIYASIIDLGTIKFGDENTERISTAQNSVVIEPITFEVGSDEEIQLLALMDSLNLVPTREKTEYKQSLRTQFIIGGKYRMSDFLTAGAMVGSRLYEKNAYTYFGINGTVNFNDLIHASLSYAMFNGTYANIGMGVSLTLPGVQVYASSDNVFGLMAMDYAKSVNARLGINVLIRGGRDKGGNSGDGGS